MKSFLFVLALILTSGHIKAQIIGFEQKEEIRNSLEAFYIKNRSRVPLDQVEFRLRSEFPELADQIDAVEARFHKMYPDRNKAYYVFRFVREDVLEYFNFFEMFKSAKETYHNLFMQYGKTAIAAYVALEIMERYVAPYIGYQLGGAVGATVLTPFLHQEYFSVPLYIFFLQMKEKFRRWRAVAPDRFFGNPKLYFQLERSHKNNYGDQSRSSYLRVQEEGKTYFIQSDIFSLSFPLWFREMFSFHSSRELSLMNLERLVPKFQRNYLIKEFGESKQVYALAIVSYLKEKGIWDKNKEFFIARYPEASSEDFLRFLEEKQVLLYEIKKEISNVKESLDAARENYAEQKKDYKESLDLAAQKKIEKMKEYSPKAKFPVFQALIHWVQKRQFKAELNDPRKIDKMKAKLKIFEKELYFLSFEHFNWFKQQLVDLEYHYLYDWERSTPEEAHKLSLHYSQILKDLGGAYKTALQSSVKVMEEDRPRQLEKTFEKRLKRSTRELRKKESSITCRISAA
ncbi:MAG: hypothetical protein VX642_15470 [Bdellovibrionota bacterium]|nr:hypothetical protein [Bdellovibrionota bacterium]